MDKNLKYSLKGLTKEEGEIAWAAVKKHRENSLEYWIKDGWRNAKYTFFEEESRKLLQELSSTKIVELQITGMEQHVTPVGAQSGGGYKKAYEILRDAMRFCRPEHVTNRAISDAESILKEIHDTRRT